MFLERTFSTIKLRLFLVANKMLPVERSCCSYRDEIREPTLNGFLCLRILSHGLRILAPM